MAASIYRPQWSIARTPVQRMVAGHDGQYDDRIAFRPNSTLHTMAKGVWCISHVWRERVDQLENLDGTAIAPGAILSMYRCLPAGVILNPKPRGRDYITCRKYAVCPFCRYRLGLKLIDEYASLAGDYPYIGDVSIFYPLDDEPVSAQTRADLRHLIDRICKHNRTWDKDVVVTVPAWGRKTSRMYYRITIIGFAMKRESFRPPEECVQTIDWPSVPPLGSTMWRVKENTKAAICRSVGRALEYSPGLLFSTVPPAQFAAMARMTEVFRVKKHG